MKYSRPTYFCPICGKKFNYYPIYEGGFCWECRTPVKPINYLSKSLKECTTCHPKQLGDMIECEECEGWQTELEKPNDDKKS